MFKTALLKHLKLQMWLPLVGHIKFSLDSVILEKAKITITNKGSGIIWGLHDTSS